MHSQVLIIGSGPAGYTAAVYAARAGLQSTMLMGSAPGGQLMLTHDVENYPGFSRISGFDLVDALHKQAESVGVKMVYESVTTADLSQRPFVLKTDMGVDWSADALIIATGSSARWLQVPGEETFKGRGISVCATCDGFFYRNKKVAVVGGGNSAVYEALFLAQTAESVALIHRHNTLTAEKKLVDQLITHPKITPYWDTTVTEFIGDNKLQALKMRNLTTNTLTTLPVDGVFEAIGHIPNTYLFQGQLDIDSNGYIITNCFNRQTSVPGVFACGDVQEPVYRQAVIAAGTGCVAALGAEKFLLDNSPTG